MNSFKPSPSQQLVIDHRGGHLQVIACAGSGKTESVARRVSALIEEGESPNAIVAFTFTEKAAAELKERIYKRVAEAMGDDYLGRLGPMFVGTIHGYCFQMLQDQVPRFGNYDVIDPHRHSALLSREHRRLDLSRLGNGHWATIQGMTEIADVVGNELIPTSDLPDLLREIYCEYCEMLDKYHYLTFSQIIQKAVEELEKPEVYARVHGPLRHLIVDEFQDINPAQERLIRQLGSEPVQVCVVGDDDQAIYQWRGSDTAHIQNFERDWPGVTRIELSTNRRSVSGIVERANEFAQTIVPRLDKEMVAHRESKEFDVVPWSAETSNAEAEQICEQIRTLHDKGFQYRDIAVLFRSVRTSAPPLLDVLDDAEIPYTCAGRTGLFLQPEVNVLGRTYIWLVDNDWRETRYGGQAETIELPGLLATYQSVFSAGEQIPGLEAFLQDWKKSVPRTNRNVNLIDDLYRLLRLLQVHKLDISDPVESSRMGALARFSRMLADYENITRRSRWVLAKGGIEEFRGGTDRGVWYYRKLANYLQHYARDAYEDFDGESFDDLDAVDVMTIHQAKGLEWPIVFVPALTARRFPTSRAGQSRSWLLPESVFPQDARARYEGGDTEERRLFYVAMTRARDCVYLSSFKRISQRQQPSPYLVDLFGADHPDARIPLPIPEFDPSTKAKEAPSSQVSFSEVAQYEDCPYQYRLANSLGFQNVLVPELGYGRAVHHVLRQIAEEAMSSGSVPDIGQVKDILSSEFYLPFANRWAFEAMSKAADQLVDRYMGQWIGDLTRIWATERPFEVHTDDGILTGRADVILDRHEGRPDSLAIVDYKSSTDSERDAVFAFQLAVYAAAGRGEGLDVGGAFLHDLQSGARHEKDVGEQAATAAVERAAGLIRGIRNAEFPARPEETKCSKCDYRRLCGAAGCSSIELM